MSVYFGGLCAIIGIMNVNMRKIYVAVTVRFSESGRMTPLSVTWSDGREYEIARVVGVRTVPPRSDAFYPVRYDCVFGEVRRYLYFEPETSRWFVEIG